MTLPLLLRFLLWPVSLLYGQLGRLRAWLYAKGFFKQRRLKKPVISIGNLTVGGTGKTPMVIWLAQRLIAEGKRVGILSRGYKGSHGTSDEIEVMKSRLGDRVVFGVGANRFAQGRRLEASVDVFAGRWISASGAGEGRGHFARRCVAAVSAANAASHGQVARTGLRHGTSGYSDLHAHRDRRRYRRGDRKVPRLSGVLGSHASRRLPAFR